MKTVLFCLCFDDRVNPRKANSIICILNSIRADLANRNRREESELQSVRTKYRTGARRNIYH